MLKFLDVEHFRSFHYHQYILFYINQQSISIQYILYGRHNGQENKDTVKYSKTTYLILYRTNN